MSRRRSGLAGQALQPTTRAPHTSASSMARDTPALPRPQAQRRNRRQVAPRSSPGDARRAPRGGDGTGHGDGQLRAAPSMWSGSTACATRREGGGGGSSSASASRQSAGKKPRPPHTHTTLGRVGSKAAPMPRQCAPIHVNGTARRHSARSRGGARRRADGQVAGALVGDRARLGAARPAHRQHLAVGAEREQAVGVDHQRQHAVPRDHVAHGRCPATPGFVVYARRAAAEEPADRFGQLEARRCHRTILTG